MLSSVLYNQIFEYLKQQIESQKYVPDQQLPTELELTKQFQVSRITVKRALEELEVQGYIYRKQGSGSFVKGMGGNSERMDLIQNTFAFVLPSFNFNGLSEYIHGASDEMESRGYYLSIHNTYGSMEKEREYLSTLPKQGIKGIIFYPTNGRSNIDIIYALYMNRYPILTIDKYCEGLPVGSVVSNNYEGGYTAATNLIQLGHSRIAFVSSVGLDAASSVKNRYFGYCQALKENGIPNDPDLVILDFLNELSVKGERVYFEGLVETLMGYGVTAIQSENDDVAMKVIRSASDLGVKVPDQLSVVGFDDSDMAASVDIPLSTVEQQFYAIGRKAAELIIESLESGEAARSFELPVTWIERQSTAPLAVNQFG